ncbi:hypothetical protein G4B88_021731 [Cannabis sativa]|uniref:Uncharacterized protein n=1 Tax=Cannabis sativa TaxID=3483 RepID=A0A7J6DK43_CANSA|nr:hypothetical protein G4B88_021731 [Cannabis sativa]
MCEYVLNHSHPLCSLELLRLPESPSPSLRVLEFAVLLEFEDGSSKKKRKVANHEELLNALTQSACILAET